VTPGTFNVPNLISFARLGLVPVFLWLRHTGQPEWALGVFILAAVSDVVDGLLARLLDQRTALGGIIDPLADKLLVFAALVSLVIGGHLPAWLLGLILVRDLPMGVGALWVRHKRLEIPAAPSRIGKYATFTLVLAVVLGLASASPHAPRAIVGWVWAVGAVAALCVVVSTLQYWSRFGYLFFAPGRKSSAAGEKTRA
jgi:cardiolipin synthase